MVAIFFSLLLSSVDKDRVFNIVFFLATKSLTFHTDWFRNRSSDGDRLLLDSGTDFVRVFGAFGLAAQITG